MRQDRSEMKVTAPEFVASHRLVSEVAAGRPVVLAHAGEERLCSPLDGGPLLSRTLAIAAPRAAHLGLPEAPAILEVPETGPSLWALATADGADLTRVPVMPGDPLAAAATELCKLAERLPAVTLAPAAGAPPQTLRADAATVAGLRAALAPTMVPVASAPVPLAAGATATITAFRNAVGGTASAIAVGELGANALVRIHSSCITGDIFGSLKCDCGAQLTLALDRIAAEGGVLIYTAQEGRGIGLVNKLRAYALQDIGLDTIDANRALGYHDDERDYGSAAAILRLLGLTSVRLMTNNPAKAASLESAGLTVTPVPLIGPVNEHNARYLATKQRRSGHLL